MSTPKLVNFQISADVRIAGLDWGGEKPLAILCHANGFCAATWSMVAKQLEQNYRVVALDARGHGHSSILEGDDAYDWQHMIDDLTVVTSRLLDDSSENQIALIAGSSLGAIIGAAAAAREPGLYRRVVMLDPPVLPNEEVVAELGLQWPPRGKSTIAEIARKRRHIFSSRQTVMETYRRKAMFAQWQNEAFEEYLRHGFRDRTDGQIELACPPSVEAAIFEHTASVDMFAEAPNVRAHVTLVHAEGGQFPYALYELLIKKFPRGELTSMQGGHLLPMELPDETAALLCRAG